MEARKLNKPDCPDNLSRGEWAAYIAIVFAMIVALVLLEVVK